ncbi:hypothetical protein Tco_0270894 [Tanacetum coccineum]
MSTLVKYMIVAGAENRPPMLDKTMYKSWQSHMLLYLKGKKNGRMMLESIQSGPFVYPTIEENGLVRDKKYAELTEQEKLQDDSSLSEYKITDVKLAKNMYNTNFDQLYAYLSQHKGHENEARMMRDRYPYPLSLVANHQTQSNSV